ncbi:hypothetical protein AB0L40_17405 [Patulibacter sp. NPDC049589]|uniref:hypothetical protein n=1 Tax=Patulibacter sp. NPDC049589 TaxID=3154731 RepID=UPI003413F1BC
MSVPVTGTSPDQSRRDAGTVGADASRVVVVRSAPEALDHARALGSSWADGALRRDAAAVPDQDALDALRRSGLLGIVVPAEEGGLGAGAGLVADVVRILAAGDPALAQQVQGHVGNVHAVRTAQAPVRRAIFADVLERGARFGNTNADGGAESVLRPVAGGYALDGTKAYSTGSSTAEWLAAPALDPDGRSRLALVRSDAPGVSFDPRWDAIGQRATFSGSTRFDGVLVRLDHVLSPWEDPVAAEARFHPCQLIHPAIEVGIAEGVLGRAWSTGRRRSTAFARAAVDVAAARALLRAAAARVDELGTGSDATTVARAGLAIHAAKALAYRTSVRTADAAVGWLEGPDAEHGAWVELAWRNARTHAVHDPGRWSFHHVGRHALTGEFPASRLPALRDRATVPVPVTAPVVPAGLRPDELGPTPGAGRTASGGPAPGVAAVRSAAAAELRWAAHEADVVRGALRDALAFVGTRTRAWPEAGVERATDEPHAILRFGELTVTLAALDGLIADGARALVARDPAGAQVAASTARLFALEHGRRIVSEALEIAGASALTRARGADRPWRALVRSQVEHPPWWEWSDLAAAAAAVDA